MVYSLTFCLKLQVLFLNQVKGIKLGFHCHLYIGLQKEKRNDFLLKLLSSKQFLFLIERCYFTVGNLVLKQDIGIPMGTDLAPFWANLFLYFFESKFVKSLVSLGSTRAYHFHSVDRFIDDLCSINDRDEFFKSCKDI